MTIERKGREARKEAQSEIPMVALFFLVAAIVTTYPLILKASYALPGGLGDPALVTFLLAWDADRLAHGLRGFWDAPFLYPHQHTVAYAEHMFGVAIFTAPLQWLTRNAVLVYNIAFLGSMAPAVVIAVELVRPRLPRARIVGDLLAAGIGIGAALAPFAWMYIRVQRERSLDRGTDDLLYYSARIADYFRISPGGWSWGGLLAPGGPEPPF